MKRSQQWKALEREAARELRGRRVWRGANFGQEGSVDTEVDDMPHLKVDCKYRVRHAHHSLLQEIVDRYCTSPADIPVLVTKSHRQRGANVTVPLHFFGLLLEVYRAAMRPQPAGNGAPTKGSDTAGQSVANPTQPSGL